MSDDVARVLLEGARREGASLGGPEELAARLESAAGRALFEGSGHSPAPLAREEWELLLRGADARLRGVRKCPPGVPPGKQPACVETVTASA